MPPEARDPDAMGLPDAMDLEVLLPTRVLVDEPITRLVAEAENGSFGLLPRHIDFVAALRPGILIYSDAAGTEHFLGIDEGILVKRSQKVMVSTLNAVPGQDLQTLRATVRQRYVELDEGQKQARGVLARLEVGVVRRFLELQELR